MKAHEARLFLANPTSYVTHLSVSVYYDKGDLGGRRGIFLSVAPIGVQSRATAYGLARGRRGLLEAATRLNQKRVQELWDSTRLEIHGRCGRTWDMMQSVLQEEKLELAEPAPEPINRESYTSTVVELVKAIERDNLFDRLTVLADALEDAGCTRSEVLNGLRTQDLATFLLVVAGTDFKGCA